MKRSDIVKLAGINVVGVESGVAEGEFSYQVLSEQDVKHWYSIDMWAGDRGHDAGQMSRATNRLKPFAHKNTIIHNKFSAVVDDFSDEYFDFIYVDGYAHTGQEGGETLTDWWPKLKRGGIFAGDDYSTQWPLTVASVDAFVAEHNLKLHIHEFDQHTHWSRFPSWYVYKPCDPSELTFDQLSEL